PAFKGVIEWQTDNGPVALGMLQQLIENHGDGHSYMLERISNFIERVLARNHTQLDPYFRKGTLLRPVGFDELPDDLQVLLGNRAAEQARLLGLRTAEMHLAMTSANTSEFRPEEMSLHYQRSLFSSMQSVTREAYQALEKSMNDWPPEVKQEAATIAYKKNDILEILKRIYSKKFDAVKIRTHGVYLLKKILVTGNDLVIQDFNGNPLRTFSERRIKRSPLRDIAEMIASFYYTAYEGFLTNNQISKEEMVRLLAFADQWAHYMCGFFIRAYLEKIGETSLLPKDHNDLEVLLQSYLLERAIKQLNVDVRTKSPWVIVSIRLIRSIIDA
ncbi:MAG TPA: alpha-amylase, partial [Flavisolibacter sp.]